MKNFGLSLLLLLVGSTGATAKCPSGELSLQARWLALWERLEKRGAGGEHEQDYRDLAARYRESHRAYHTLEHVEHLLDELDAVRGLAEDPDAVEFALWFHDAVYDIGAGNNEEESARLARAAALGHGMPAAWADRVSSLVLATRHAAPPVEADAQLVVDIDLSILGQPWERFDAYENQILAEYAPLLEEHGAARFSAGRAAILRRFLDRPTIYSTRYFQEKYEEPARANLRRSIARLESPDWPKTAEGTENRPRL